MTRTDLVGEALHALAAHRLRASLSTIGIVFGVATVVAALAIGDGARREAFDEIGSLGINNVFIRATHPSDAAAKKGPPAPELTTDDARALDMLPGVVAMSGVRSARTEVSNGGRRQTTSLAGVMPAWIRIAEPKIASGRWLVDRDVAAARRVMVLGAGLAHQLFGDNDAIGQRVFAGGVWYQVVGVFEAEAARRAKATPIARIDRETAALVPLTAMDLPLGDGDRISRIEEIDLLASAPEAVARLSAAADALMRRRHPAHDAWELVVPKELLEARVRAERVFTAVLMGVGGLALLISGIGIMNIMLASVAERTQEIGVRRAFGARAAEVIAQFAVEATLLSVGGGAVGIPTGVLLASIVAAFAGWPVAISAGSIALAFTVAVIVGLSFGVYPARVAARIQPIDALRAS